jgi:hypothetical protein
VAVAACEDLLWPGDTLALDVSCDRPTPVDWYGTAHLDVTQRSTAFLVRGGAPSDAESRIYDRFINRSGRLRLSSFLATVGDAFLPPLFAALNPPIEIRADLGTIFWTTKDCTALYAATRIEINAGAGSPVPFVWAGYGVVDTSQTASNGLGGIVNVPPGQSIELSAYHPTTGERVARRRVLVAPSGQDDVVLLPSARP